MNKSSFEQHPTRLRETAQALPYPNTPDIASSVRQRLAHQHPKRHGRWRRRTALAITLVLLLLLSVPQVRASVAQIFQLGAVQIVLDGSAPETATLPATDPTALLNLAGETTLEQARQTVAIPIRLPSYPTDLGPPDRVYVQDLDGTAVVLVWIDRDQPEKIRLSLHLLTSQTFVKKSFAAAETTPVEETTINGQQALWVQSPHLLQIMRNGAPVYETQRLVEGHVLIWTESSVTYRLETALPLDQAIRIAESLQ